MIVCKTQVEVGKMRRSGQVLRQVIEEVVSHVAPANNTMDLERVAENKIAELGATEGAGRLSCRGGSLVSFCRICAGTAARASSGAARNSAAWSAP